MNGRDELFPKRDRFGVGIVDPERANATVHPVFDHVDQFPPKVLPVRAVEVQRVDVLILLRWIFRIADRSVGPLIKPIRMILHVRVIGRAIEGKVERDLQSTEFGLFDQPQEIPFGSKGGFNVTVTASRATNRPGRADIVRSGREGVVLSFARGDADGMDRREVNHIEAHGLGVVQSGHAIPEPGMFVGAPFGSAGKKLVPCRESGQLPLRNHSEGLGLGGKLRVGKPVHQRLKCVRKEDVEKLIGRQFGQEIGAFFDLVTGVVGSVRAGPFGGVAQEAGAFERLNGRIWIAGLDSNRKCLFPRPKAVRPSFDDVFPATEGRETTLTVPAISVDDGHGSLEPAAGADFPPAEACGEDVVAILEDVGIDVQRLFQHPFDRVATALNGRVEILNDDGGGVFGSGCHAPASWAKTRLLQWQRSTSWPSRRGAAPWQRSWLNVPACRHIQTGRAPQCCGAAP